MKKSLLLLIFVMSVSAIYAQSDIDNYYDGIEFRKEFKISKQQYKNIREINDIFDIRFEEIGLNQKLTAAQKVATRRELLYWRQVNIENQLSREQQIAWKYRKGIDIVPDDLEEERLDYIDSRMVDSEFNYSNAMVKLEYLYDEKYIDKKEYEKGKKRLKEDLEAKKSKKKTDTKSIKNRGVYQR